MAVGQQRRRPESVRVRVPCKAVERRFSVTARFRKYRRIGVVEMRQYVEGESLADVPVSYPDKLDGSPKPGDVIARNPANHDDQWLVSKEYFEKNFEETGSSIADGLPVQVINCFGSEWVVTLRNMSRDDSRMWIEARGESLESALEMARGQFMRARSEGWSPQA